MIRAMTSSQAAGELNVVTMSSVTALFNVLPGDLGTDPFLLSMTVVVVDALPDIWKGEFQLRISHQILMTKKNDYRSICELLVPCSVVEHTSLVAGPYFPAHYHIISSSVFALYPETLIINIPFLLQVSSVLPSRPQTVNIFYHFYFSLTASYIHYHQEQSALIKLFFNTVFHYLGSYISSEDK